MMRIVTGRDRTILAAVGEPDVCAAIYAPSTLPWWHRELDAAVASGAFHIDRTFFEADESADLMAGVRAVWPAGVLDARITRAVEDDIAELLASAQELGACNRLRLRIFAQLPDRRHGFHVDLASGVAARSLLRVYSGPGTQFVEPRDVRTMLDFYRSVEQRETLVRELPASSERLADFDDAPPFLRPAGRIYETPPAAIVAIEHVREAHLTPLDIINARADGWVHRSPMTGAARFVVTVTLLAQLR